MMLAALRRKSPQKAWLLLSPRNLSLDQVPSAMFSSNSSTMCPPCLLHQGQLATDPHSQVGTLWYMGGNRANFVNMLIAMPVGSF